MASSVPFLLLFVGLFTTIVGDEDCSMYGGKYEWCVSGKFCCGTCGETYCCSDPQNRVQGRVDCLLKSFKNFGAPPRRGSVPGEDVPVVIMPILVTLIIVLITCWVCPCCCLYKRFRSPVMATTTVVTTQYLPQPGGQYFPYQPLPSDPSYGGQPMPTGAFRGQPHQEAAGPGYPVPFSQAPNDGGQAMYPIQPDYTSAQPAYNPAYVDTTSATPAQSIKTSY